MALTTSLGNLIQRSFVYNRIPTLLFDDAERIVALNIACRTLFGVDAAGWVGRTSVEVSEALGARLHGYLCPFYTENFGDARATGINSKSSTSHVHVLTSECSYSSERLGQVVLSTSAVPNLDKYAGIPSGTIVTLGILDPEIRRRFELVLESRWNHELVWELYAMSYDRVLPELWFYREVVERHCVAMSAVGINSVLDVGTGTGVVTISLLKRGQRVTAVDVGAPMLRQLVNKLDEITALNVVVIEDTAERLPQLADASFDGVTVLLAFFDMQRPHSALDEAIRVLRPGGTLVITEPKENFNVHELMLEAECDLARKGLTDRLRPDWERIQAVAPVVAETIRENQNSTDITRRPWHAEAIYQILLDRDFHGLRMEDSHLGNCSTIWAIKPA